ncbi:hypothetical protein EB796_000629 [Bugula neritina]|uniref:G-protein coupled receptors family 1 profile domain-containing protein n=1 Tax=Bugula neritina TaxID=10212 RepID=A0A7J7KS84_BUGNE|nr:hypothetical protein EB796_000629 [Bugula neritina]
MVNSSGCYMAALAIPDNVFLILHATFSSIRWCPNCVMLTNYPVMCQLLPMLYTSTQCMSTLLVLMFTIEQFIAIRYPFKRSRYCRVSIAKKIIIGGRYQVCLDDMDTSERDDSVWAHTISLPLS